MNNQTTEEAAVNTGAFGALYIQALKQFEAEQQKDATSLVAASLGNTLSLLETVALYARALEANLAMFDRATSELTAPEVQTQKLIFAGIGSSFPQEADFCRRMETMHRERILKDHSIDPTDDAAVAQFFKNFGTTNTQAELQNN